MKNNETTKACALRLGIEEKELKALAAVRNDLALGEIKRTDVNAKTMVDPLNADHDDGALDLQDKVNFNMQVGARNYKECGSVHCIGGGMGIKMGLTLIEADHYVRYMDKDVPLFPLLYPGSNEEGGDDQYDYNKITPKQAIQAIDNFIATGKPNWASIPRMPKITE